jgi:hypothetical protein
MPTLALLLLVQDYVDVDYATIDRKISKEPAYVAEPRYALFILDPAAKARAWAVLDKSKRDLEHYDVMYFDRNFNGDLTEPEERFASEYRKAGEASGTAVTLRVGEIQANGLRHTGFEVSTVPKKGRSGIWFRMKWDGKEEISGGYAPVGTDTTEWGPSTAKAPVLRPSAVGPFSFALYGWGDNEVTLTIGAAEKAYIIVGNPGSGPDTLCSVSEHFLKEDYLVATLIAKDKDGKELTTRNEIRGHC